MKWTKLDRYNYDIFSGYVRIRLCGTNDPDLVDIMSEIARSNGMIYIEGRRFEYLDKYQIHGNYEESFIDLDVKEIS